MVSGLMTELHPQLNDLVPSVVTVVHRRYRKYVDRADLTQEAYAWVMTRVTYFNGLLEDENDAVRLINQKRIAFQMRRAIERYARKEKAARSGYQTNDESFYDTVTIAQLLPYVIASVVNDTAIEQAQNLINDGTPRKPAAPAEGGNLLATLIDIKKSYELLDEDDTINLKAIACFRPMLIGPLAKRSLGVTAMDEIDVSLSIVLSASFGVI